MSDIPDNKNYLSEIIIFILIAVPPASTRIILFYKYRDLEFLGFASDIFATGIATFLLLSSRRLRPLLWLFGAFWGVLHYANYEHIAALGSLVTPRYIRFLTDAAFLEGSAQQITQPLLAVACLLAPLTAVYIISYRYNGGIRRTGPLVSAALALAVWLGIDVDNVSYMDWRSYNVVHANADLFVRTLRQAQKASDFDTPADDQMSRDPAVNGEWRFAAPEVRRNVLLIVLEGVSGAYLPSTADYHGRTARIRMTQMDMATRDGLQIPNFLTHQRQTNRGLYAILCGDYPSLVAETARMTRYDAENDPACLPTYMAARGYQTIYMQAADLRFMSKDIFLPAAGFQEVRGEAHLSKAEQTAGWGLDDGTLFETALARIAKLETQPRPWFLTLLTVGTHHPYTVPRKLGTSGASERVYAFRYLDHAVSKFLHALKAKDILSDTLVVVTSDESQGMMNTRRPFLRTINQNWGVLRILAPDLVNRQILATHSHIDIPVSILDYIGFLQVDTPMLGRSVFRNYDTPRHVLFGNTYLHMVGGYHTEGSYRVCDEIFINCRAYQVPSARIFARTESEGSTLPIEDVQRLKSQVEQTRHPLSPSDNTWLPLGGHTVILESRESLIFGGHGIRLRKDQTIAVRLRGRVVGEESSALVALRAALISSANGKHLERPDLPKLRSGEAFDFSFTYSPSKDISSFEFKLNGKVVEKSKAQIFFDEAVFQLRDSNGMHGLKWHISETGAEAR